MSFANPTDVQFYRKRLEVAYGRAIDPLYQIKEPQGYYVYVVYREDTGEPIYIGKGKGNRMYAHISDMKKGKVSAVKKYTGMIKLDRLGITMNQRAIWDGLSSNAALELESDLISRIGSDRLLNATTRNGNADRMAIQQAKWAIAHLDPSKRHLEIFTQIKNELLQAINAAKVNLAIDGLRYE